MNYIDIVKKLLTEISEAGNDQDLKHHIVFDDEHKRYLVIQSGNFEGEFIYDVLVAIKIEAEKVIVERTTLDINFEEELIYDGIKKENIVFQ